MSHTNVLNRKLEEVYGVGKEFTTVAHLWGVSRCSFFTLVWDQGQADDHRNSML